jgi:hypothetical protein
MLIASKVDGAALDAHSKAVVAKTELQHPDSDAVAASPEEGRPLGSNSVVEPGFEAIATPVVVPVAQFLPN